MTTALVSIVTPSYNQAAFLEDTIRSVLEQDYEPIEYVVVDDGSTDGSIEIVRRYEDRLTAAIRQENAGQVAALNRGFARTSGELMGYLNSDDTLLPGALARMAAELERDARLLLVYGDALYTDERGRQTGYLPSREFDVATMVRACDNHVVQPSTLWRREAWERFGPLNEDGWYFFDFEFFLAETFFTDEALPEAARPVAKQGRASAYLLGAEFAYDALDLPLARRYALTGLRLDPRRGLSPRWASLAAKTFLPRGVVSRLRARRRAAVAARA